MLVEDINHVQITAYKILDYRIRCQSYLLKEANPISDGGKLPSKPQKTFLFLKVDVIDDGKEKIRTGKSRRHCSEHKQKS